MSAKQKSKTGIKPLAIPKIGFRNIKTALVVFLCLLIALVFKRENPFYSSIAAVVCMQQTYEQTFKLGINRVIGTFIGGVFGFMLLKLSDFIPYYHQYIRVVIIPLFIIALIYICNVINKKQAVSICCIVFLSIVANANRDVSDAFMYVLDRVIDTSIGIVLAMLVNRFIAPVRDVVED